MHTMVLRLPVLLGLICLLGGSLPAHAQTVKWVDQAGGSDANDGNTEATAYATLQHAVNNSANGLSAANPSMILVKDGAYVGVAQANGGGFSTAILIDNLDYLEVKSAPGHEPSILPAATSNNAALTVQNSDHVVVDNIDLDGTNSGWDLMHVRDSDNLTVRNCDLGPGEDGIDIETGASTHRIESNTFFALTEDAIDYSDGNYNAITISGNRFLATNRRPILIRDSGGLPQDFLIERNISDGTNSQEAFRIIGATDVVIVNNCIRESTQQGIYIDSGCSNITIVHNTLHNNGEEELKTKITGADLVIKNNIFSANGSSAAISIPSGNGPLPGEDYNLVFNDGASTEGGSQSQVTVFGAGTLFGDPLFLNAAGGDLRLGPGSPAVEAGTDLGVNEDIDQDPRPAPPGTDPDMGAKELPSAVPVHPTTWGRLKGDFGTPR